MIATVAPAFVMGLLGGAHCVAMCGTASAALCAQRGRYAVSYNVGRAVGYSIIGVVVGALGALPAGGPLDVVRFVLRAAAAICMLAVGLHLFGLPSFVGRLEALGGPLWRRVSPIARRLVPLRSSPAAFAAGALWALMPCGLLYGALALAATADSALGGGVTMAAFAAGTLPLMITIASMARRVASLMSRPSIRRAAGALVLALGLWSTAGIADQIGLARAPHACCAHR